MDHLGAGDHRLDPVSLAVDHAKSHYLANAGSGASGVALAQPALDSGDCHSALPRGDHLLLALDGPQLEGGGGYRRPNGTDHRRPLQSGKTSYLLTQYTDDDMHPVGSSHLASATGNSAASAADEPESTQRRGLDDPGARAGLSGVPGEYRPLPPRQTQSLT